MRKILVVPRIIHLPRQTLYNNNYNSLFFAHKIATEYNPYRTNQLNLSNILQKQKLNFILGVHTNTMSKISDTSVTTKSNTSEAKECSNSTAASTTETLSSSSSPSLSLSSVMLKNNQQVNGEEDILKPDVLDQLKNSGFFKERIGLLSIRVPIGSISHIMKNIKSCLLRNYRYKNVVNLDEEKNFKLVLLDPQYKKSCDLPQKCRDFLDELNGSNDSENSLHFINHEIELDYENFSAEKIIRKIINHFDPSISNQEICTSYEQIGHIAHLNIRDRVLRYRYLIGRILLEKNSQNIETVVNKVGMIDTKFREFKMELLCGKDDYNVEMKEHGNRFRFNFKEVYWNSRLSTEHQRILKHFNGKNDIICDMFAGVGPFAIPIAKNLKIPVYANDLNPKSFEYMKKNVALNRVQNYVKCHCMDGRDFVRYLVHQEHHLFNHVIMNLPGSAVEFLDAFVGLYNQAVPSERDPMMLEFPTIHCYTFISCDKKDSDSRKIDLAKESVENVLFASMRQYYQQHQKQLPTIEYVEIYNVRDVAPKKEMFCISFKLPREVALFTDPFKEGSKQHSVLKRKQSDINPQVSTTSSSSTSSSTSLLSSTTSSTSSSSLSIEYQSMKRQKNN